MTIVKNREYVCAKIISFCKSDYKSLSEIAAHLEMNKHTLRAHYLYPLRSEGKLLSLDGVARSGARYIAAK